jgi:hypothetical protein
MRARMKARLVLPIAAALSLLLAAGCGGNGDDSSSDPATLAPPRSPLYLEATIQPQGEVKTNVERLFAQVSGLDTDLGQLIVSKLESSASSSGEELDFEKEVAPWLGEKGGLSFQHYDGDDFSGYGVAIQTTDAAATQAFIDRQTESSDEPAREGSYQGVDFEVQSDDGTTVGVVGDFIAFAEDENTFKAMVDASDGESLADEETFANAIDAAPGGSFADAFVDVGGLIDQAGGSIDSEARAFLDSAGIDPEDATAVASLIPGSDQVEIDISTDLGGQNPPSGDASGLLGELPAGSFAAVASADFGKRLEEAIDSIDAEGIRGEVPPHKFKSTLKEAGVDVDEIASSLDDLGVFAEGSDESSLGGAVVLTTDGSGQAANTVSNLGLLLRASGTPGVTAISGETTGFSIRGDELGPKPLVVAARGERIAIGYGLPAAKQALATGSGATLADDPTYKEAVAALGDTPISGFADGPAALRVASAALTGSEEQQEFEAAKPYLAKIAYLAIGSGSSGDLATAKLIAGIGK